ncbi:MAG: ATP-binding protein [Sediminibacterium sp.]|nr:ATP-binding protein [Sediminibacterium sp.]
MEGIIKDKREKNNIRPFRFILLLSLLLMVVLFFVQSRSDKSIRAMQKGNELAVKTFHINNTLQEIINHVYFLESQTRKQINEGKIHFSGIIADTLAGMDKHVKKIESLTANGEARKSYAILQGLLQHKIAITKNILGESPNASVAREKMLGEQNKNLIDSIYLAASDIQMIAEKELQDTIIRNSEVSNQVLIISRSLTIFALVTIVLSATLIFRHLMRNNKLILELEQAKEKADTAGNIKEQFLANMSHEIRTPLNSIIGFSNLANKTPLNNEQKEYISFIKSSSENLLYIINDILDFSKLEAGKLQISKAPFNLKDICHFIEMLFQVQISDKKIHFSCQIDNNIPLNLTGDDDRLKQILTNLVSNAIKFTGVGGNISLKIQSEKQEDEIVYIRFAVKDSGIGIPEEKLKTIFERFEQADSATTRKYGGTGLGLSIVKQLVTLQNGTVAVNSKINSGSEFIVTIPYSINHLTSEQMESGKHAVLVRRYNKKARILIAEDNKMNQMLLKYLFQNWEMNITLAHDGQEAIDLIEKQDFDLIMLDIQMPVVDGYGVVKWIRETKKSKVPVVAMTAHTMPTEIEQSKAAGMDDYLPKPLIEENVIRIFNKYIPLKESATDYTQSDCRYVCLSNLKKLFGDDPAVIRELMEHFSKNYPEEIKELNTAYENRQLEKVYTIAHNLKTTVGALNFNSELLPTLTAIEAYKFKEADWDQIGVELNILNKSLADVEKEIEELQQIIRH